MRCPAIAVMLTLLAALSASATDEIAAGQVINSLFPGYVSMKEAELDPAMVEYLRRAGPIGHNRSLTVVIADFDGNGLDDYAAIIRAEDNSNGSFVVIFQTKEGQFRAVHRTRFGTVIDFAYLIQVEAGQEVRETEAIGGPTKTVLLQHPAVELNYFEKSSVVFYWDPATGQIDETWTSD